MSLVDDDQIEVPDPETALPVLRFVDQPHHRRIGRNKHAPFGVLFGDQVDGWGVGQKSFEGTHGLIDQGHPVGQEQHAFDPIAAHEQVAKRDHRARLARARGHHHQGFAVVVALEGLADAANAACLVVALDNVLVDWGPGQQFAGAAPLDEQFQLGLLVEALHLAWRILPIVPDPMVVAVGIEDHRALAEARLQAIRVQLRLLLSHARIPPRALGFDQSQRLAIIAPQHIVDEALALVVGHAVDLELPVARLGERPASLLEQQVDEGIARLGLGVVMRIGLRGRDLPRLGDLGSQAREFRIQRSLVCQQCRQLLVALAQTTL